MNKKVRYIILAKNGNRITIKAPRYMKAFIKARYRLLQHLEGVGTLAVEHFHPQQTLVPVGVH